MPAVTTTEFSDARHSRGIANPDSDSPGNAPDSVASIPKPKPRTPRPCFDDGSLTRVFKFPSRTYPKSTFYVTSTEIIIRIKKARKKWKLVVPKKRVRSYRTNRWFTKPRWIELELTYTQASRLGLVEPRKPAKDLGGETAVTAETTGDGAATNEAFVASAPVIAPEAAGPGDSLSELEFEAGFDSAELRTDDDTSDFDIVADQADDWTQNSPPQPQWGDAAPEPVAHELLLVEFHQPIPQQVADVTAIVPSSRNRGRTLVLLCTGLGLLLMSVAGAWLTFDSFSSPQKTVIATCPQGSAAASCDHAVAKEAPSVEHAAIAPVPERAAPEVPKASAEPLEQPEGRPEARSIETGSLEPELPAALAVKSETTPPEVTAASQPGPQQEAPNGPHPCRELTAATQSVSIWFDFASPRLDHTVLASLAALAAKLQACQSVRIIVEGHTDTDGHEDRNETLSWRRAEAVRDYLITSGAKPGQLSVIGYGQSRPSLPNVSSENKRRNRRVALVAEHRP